MEDQEDAVGHGMMEHLRGDAADEVAERDDGYFDATGGPKCYFAEYDEWPKHEKRALERVRGRVLDIGCGAGRHSLHLQEKGLDITGIDISPLATEVCRLRGLRKARTLSITQVTSELGIFDTLVMLGNNFGLFGNAKRARWLLKRFRGITSEKGRIVAETLNPHDTEVQEHLDYHECNRSRGRMAGEARLRMRYRKYATPWFDYLFVSCDEMKEILEGTGWRVDDHIQQKGPAYVAIIEKV